MFTSLNSVPPEIEGRVNLTLANKQCIHIKWEIKLNPVIEFISSYGCLFFAKNMGKNLSIKYEQKLPDNTKMSPTDATKTTSKRAT